jgi:hypothetical protein
LAVDENTSRRTPAARIASSTRSAPTALLPQYFSGACTLSPAAMNAAKCSTPSKSGVSTSPIVSCTRPRTNRAPAGTAAATPVDRSSRTTTSCPASSSRAVTTLPT